MSTAKQNSEFLRSVISGNLLEEAISWISSNMTPEDVFSREVLELWAENNGYQE